MVSDILLQVHRMPPWCIHWAPMRLQQNASGTVWTKMRC